MNVTLKPLAEQAIVITGASSGIGLTTARMAAMRGARVVLAARSEDALRQAAEEIRSQGGDAAYVAADVSRQEDVGKIAQTAVDAFGGFDSWVNNAGVGLYGEIENVPIEDMRGLFDTNFWSVVYGSLEAASHLRRHGGALINIGSITSDRAVPLQGIYSASKHAVKGFTDALRMELEAEGAPVSVTLVKPGPIDTPFTMNAKNYLDSAPQHVPPVYAPQLVAQAILHCAETTVRDLFVGGGGKGMAASGYYAPRMTDRMMEKGMIPGTKSGRPPRPVENNALDRPSRNLRERGDYPGHVAGSSLYTQASLHPLVTGAVIAGLGLAVGAMLTRKNDATAFYRGPSARRPTRTVRDEQTIDTQEDFAPVI